MILKTESGWNWRSPSAWAKKLARPATGLAARMFASGDGLRNALRGGVFGDVARLHSGGDDLVDAVSGQGFDIFPGELAPFFPLDAAHAQGMRQKLRRRRFRAGIGPNFIFAGGGKPRRFSAAMESAISDAVARADVQPDGGVYAVQLGVRQARLLPQARAALFAGSRAAQRADIARQNRGAQGKHQRRVVQFRVVSQRRQRRSRIQAQFAQRVVRPFVQHLRIRKTGGGGPCPARGLQSPGQTPPRAPGEIRACAMCVPPTKIRRRGG